ncbi:MAG: serine/threonine protein kinase [Cyanobacteria bacterium SZAS LIN-3]|nr:serine/threonine protein kinase [Cyanobacteria bacterium SZAS LIN-3]
MAELQVEAKYKTAGGKTAFSVMCALFPLWALIAPAALGYLIGSTFVHPEARTIVELVCTSFALIGTILIGLIGTAVSEDNRLFATKTGLSFPLYLLPRLNYRRNRNWSDLSGASLVSNGQQKTLTLSFLSGGFLSFNLANFDAKNIEELLLAIELWGQNCKRAPELVDYQQSLQAIGKDDHSAPGYTQMWEEELSRRFSATTFVPLEPDHVLQDGRLKIVRQLAFGGLSAIYLAQNRGTELVVLKEAVIPGNNDAEARAQAEKHLARESKLLGQLDHPNIAKVYDYFIEDGRHYLQMEYINGADLRQFVKQNGCPPLETTLQWSIVIADILKYLHGQDPPIIHKDLTPDNLVLCHDGRLVLIDFGASNQFISKATNTIVGKQSYIPPEQLRGKTVTQSDLYAFGGTMHYLLTGKDPKALQSSHPRSLNETVPESIDAIVARATAFEPEQRYQSAEEIGSALRESLAQLQVHHE